MTTRMTSETGRARAIEEHFIAKDEVRRFSEINPGVPERLREIARWLDADFRANGLTFEIKQAPGAEPWSRRYALTPAETRLAAHLLAGGTPATYAAAQALSPHTVRNHLRSIYAKTNTNRQVSLLQLLLRISGKDP
jgi:DNA-binding CsgD family transcriptional regulator